MSTDIVKYAFIAGEVSPTLYGRTDLTKFDLGMSEARNFFVDYRGGLSSRPGTQFMEFVKGDQNPVRFARFSFSPEDEDTYMVLFGNGYIRFLQSGNYVLKAAQNITGATKANPAVLTVAGHGHAAGTWVRVSGVLGMTELNGKYYEVRNPTANTFQLYSVPDGAAVDSSLFTAYTSGGTIEAVYELASPYTSADLEGLNFDQYRDQLKITSRDDLPIRNLVRADHTSWSLVTEAIEDSAVGPTITGSSSSAAGSAQTLFAITSVYDDGSESAPGPVYKLSGVVNYPVTEGAVSISWSPDADAVHYNVYRSIVSVNEVLSYGMELGYAGQTRGTKFTDPNIAVDFGRAPPRNFDPFEPGAITSIEVTAGGAGYSVSTVVSITDPNGTGFSGRVIVDDSGAIVNVIVLNGGSGYSAPTVSFAGGGAGATATANARALTGTYPALSATFQQRQVYAATDLAPVTVWGSQYKRFSNFNFSDISLDSDSFEFTLDTPGVAPIRHMLATRGGLLLMTQENVWLLNGGSGDKPLTPNSALADPHTYTGVSLLEPLRIGEDVLYTEGKGYAVRLLSYNELSRVYSGDDKSILATHLFGPGKEIIRWGYQESPYKTVWCVRADGALLAFTVVKNEEVFAWTPCYTRGKVVDLVVVREGQEDRVYITVERFIGNRWTKFVERMNLRQFVNVEDAWCVDCGLSLDGSVQSGSATIYKSGDVYTVQVSGATLTGSEDKVLRAANGVFVIETVTSATSAILRLIVEPTTWVPETNEAYTFPDTDWTLDTPVTELSGLDHLEGETVSILADGNVFPQQVVTNGKITLEEPVTRAIVGLPFTCKARTLPLIVPEAGIEGKRKRVVAVSMRLTRSRGLKVGDDYDRVYPLRERTNEPWGAPIRLQDGIKHQAVGTTWDEDAFTHFLLTDPTPVTLLSLIQDAEVGDDPD